MLIHKNTLTDHAFLTFNFIQSISFERQFQSDNFKPAHFYFALQLETRHII